MEQAADAGIKKRLREAGRKVFAERGLQNATVREICALAGANVAAVNYHFGGKEKLYVAVLEEHIQAGHRRYPLDAGVTPGSMPEERLHAYVRGSLLLVLGDGDKEYDSLAKLLMLELVEPSQHFSVLFDRHMRPNHDLLVSIVRDLLPGVDEERVARCAASIAGQCVLFDFAKEAMLRVCPEMGLKASNIDRVTEFIMEFSLGGIARLRAGD